MSAGVEEGDEQDARRHEDELSPNEPSRTPSLARMAASPTHLADDALIHAELPLGAAQTFKYFTFYRPIMII